MDVQVISALLGIILIDLVLSGDNALVIAMAVRRLSPEQRRPAILIGVGGAVGLRVLFTVLAAVLLQIPLLQALGGVVLAWIALGLLTQDEREHNVKEVSSLRGAVWTIIVADAVMSFDNMLAVGAAAHGSVILLLVGLAVSMPIVIFGSGVVANLMNRMPWLVPIGAAVLANTAGRMLVEDRFLEGMVPGLTGAAHIVPLAAVLVVIGLAVMRSPAIRPLRHYGIAVASALALLAGSFLLPGSH